MYDVGSKTGFPKTLRCSREELCSPDFDADTAQGEPIEKAHEGWCIRVRRTAKGRSVCVRVQGVHPRLLRWKKGTRRRAFGES